MYSIGIIMWQISSGRQPFYSENYDMILACRIIGGEREKIIEGTPIDYSNLYTSKLILIFTELFFCVLKLVIILNYYSY
jgi:hypothetical protein